MTRVLVVLKYAPPGSPQDQQRGQVYAPLFRAAGIDARYVARYPMWTMGRGRLPARSAQPQDAARRSLAARAARRIFDAVNDRRIAAAARDADVVFLVKPDSAALVRALRSTTHARLVFDLADVRRENAYEAGITADIASHVDAITVDNDAAFGYAGRFGKPIFLFPPLAYIEQFAARRGSSRRGLDGRVVVGWMGTPSTVSNMDQIVEALQDVFRAAPNAELRLLGVPSGHEILSRFEPARATSRLAYDADSMVREVLDMDIGLFPQYDTEHAAMHGVTKALIYMGGGAAVVASPVGEVARLIRDGENGLLATGPSEWVAKLGRLVGDPALRARLADAGLRSVEETNSIQRCFASLRHALEV